MGLAERFKDKLEKRNIFEKNMVTLPIQKNSDIEIKEPQEITNVVEPVKNILDEDLKLEQKRYKFEDVETQLINKIRKTPYWSEFSVQRQEKMICSYIDRKKLVKNDITPLQLKELVKNIIVLANH